MSESLRNSDKHKKAVSSKERREKLSSSLKESQVFQLTCQVRGLKRVLSNLEEYRNGRRFKSKDVNEKYAFLDSNPDEVQRLEHLFVQLKSQLETLSSRKVNDIV